MSILSFLKSGAKIYLACIECGKPKKSKNSQKLPLCIKCAGAKRVKALVDGDKKLCTKCREWKPITDFYRNEGGAGGRLSTCKVCSYNPEKKHAYNKKISDHHKQWSKEYRQAHLEEVREKEKLYYENNKEERKAQRRAYAKKHPEKERQYRQTKWARRFSNGDNVTDQEWQQVLTKYGYKCVKCGSTEDITQDHVIPVSKGGRHIASNLQPLCRSCNSRKHTKVEDYR